MQGARRNGVGLLIALTALVGAIALVAFHEGYRVYVVHTGSMMPTYNPGDALLDSPPGALRPGEVITFLHSGLSNDVVTHRITDLSNGVIHTKGDANPTPDVWDIRPDQVQGRVIASAPYVGYALIYAKQPLGLASIFTVAVGLILLWQLFFPSTPEGGSPVPVAAVGRHRRTPRTAPAAGTRWRTGDPGDASVEVSPASGSRHARRRGGSRHAVPVADVADPDRDPSPTGRHSAVVRAAAQASGSRHRSGSALSP